MDEHTVTSQPPSMAEVIERIERIERLVGATAERPMRVGQVAQRLGVDRSTVHRWISSGKCPASMWRGRWEIPAGWVRDVILHGTPSST